MAQKKVDVLIEDGIEETDFHVWADDDMKVVIESIEGVALVFNNIPTKYHVYIDPRYDRSEIIKEIEKKIKEKTYDN
jgi:hypothetical protein